MTVDYQDLQINGVRVETYGTPSAAPPLLFVHGGCQGSWAWEKMAPRLAGAGWYAVCLNWFGHHGSKVRRFGRRRGEPLACQRHHGKGPVTDWLGRAPVVVAHSMGGVPTLAYASANSVTAVILLAPVLPAGLGVGPIDLPVDPAALWLPPPHMIDATWWGEVSAQEGERPSLLSAESPQAVLEATRWLCEIDTRHVDAPALIFAVRADPLVPLKSIHVLAEVIGATVVTLENTGHGVPLNPVWANVTAQIDPWLGDDLPVARLRPDPLATGGGRDRYPITLMRGGLMASDQAVQFATFLGALRARFSNPDLDSPTVRDIVDTMHLATKEPEGVSYAEEDAGGVEALWRIRLDNDPDAVLLHSHLGGSVVASMHSDRKAAAHIARAAGVRSLVLNYRRSPEHKFPAQIEDVQAAYDWLLQRDQPEIASVGHSVGGNLAISLGLRLRDNGAALPGALLSISPWVDLAMTNETLTNNAERDKLLSRPLLEFFLVGVA